MEHNRNGRWLRENIRNGGSDIFGTRSLLGFIYKGAACTAIGVRVSHNTSINNVTLYTNTNRRGDNNPLGARRERAKCRSEILNSSLFARLNLNVNPTPKSSIL